jgi:hypothetical protein
MMTSVDQSPALRGRRHWLGDAAVAALLAIAAAYAAWLLTGLQGHIPILTDAKADDVWFEADVSRVFDNMTLRLSNHFRSQVHPLFSLFGLGLTHVFGWVFRLDPLGAVRMTIAWVAGLWAALFFVLLRTLGCPKLDSTVFTVVAAVSGAALFWSAVPETYLLGSVTIIVALLTTAWAERRSIPAWVDVGMAAASLSVLVTNFMFGLISLSVRHKLKVAAQLAANALVVVVLLWSAQKFAVPSAHFFIGDHEARAHVPDVKAIPGIMFLDTMVMPDVRSIANDSPELWPKLSVQDSTSWKLTGYGRFALIAWVALFATGLRAMWKIERLRNFRRVLALGIAGQLLLHLLYGNESYLYALDWLPLLVTVAALGSLTRLRWLSLTAALLFIVCAGRHNYAELKFALDTLSTYR